MWASSDNNMFFLRLTSFLSEKSCMLQLTIYMVEYCVLFFIGNQGFTKGGVPIIKMEI